MRRTILIGDLHGCHDEAVELLDACAASEADRVIFLGDLVDRGPKPRQCVELAMRYECILGNHEEKHLQQRGWVPVVLAETCDGGGSGSQMLPFRRRLSSGVTPGAKWK